MADNKEDTSDIKGRCPVCDGDIASVKTQVPNCSPEWMIMGPGGEHNYRTEESFHCLSCGVKFAFPTPKSISDMTKRQREATAMNTLVK